MVLLKDFDYELPSELIAQHPSERRDSSRLMVLDRQTGKIEHAHFGDLPGFLDADDLLVLNNTRVFPARLYGKRPGKPGWIEVLLVRSPSPDVWEVLAKPGKKLKPGVRLVFEADGFEATVLEGPASFTRLLAFEYRGEFWDWIDKLGQMPLPPYIQRGALEESPEDRERYQTVFARVRGSIAAPTAGLHFTPKLLSRIRHVELTLHVGYGTFKPVKAERVEDHQVDSEYYQVSCETAAAIQAQRAAGKRIVAVGTTSTRVLEHVARSGDRVDLDGDRVNQGSGDRVDPGARGGNWDGGSVTAGSGWTQLYIYPGFRFRVVDALVTNFHLPGSSLLLLVSAFASRELIREAYQEAIRRRYRFYSYGDAMLIL